MGDGEGREHGPTGPSTNANPPDIPPERQGGPEQSGCGCRRGPTASANEAHKGGWFRHSGQTARGASVSRRAGQHDDAEKAGTTPGDAKAGKAAGPIPFSDSRLASSDGWRKWRQKL